MMSESSEKTDNELAPVYVEFNGEKTALHKDLPAPGQGAREHLETLGFSAQKVEQLISAGVIIAQ